jgi:hypothetical protein
LQNTAAAVSSKYFRDLVQVGIIVKDARRSAEEYWNLLGIGPWKLYTYAPPKLSDMTIRGKKASFSMKLAFAWSGSMMLELIEPLSGETVYKEFLTRGEGIHHIASFSVENIHSAISELNKQGIETLQAARYSNSGFESFFVYMDTQKELGTIIELVSPHGTRPQPEEVVPGQPIDQRQNSVQL